MFEKEISSGLRVEKITVFSITIHLVINIKTIDPEQESLFSLSKIGIFTINLVKFLYVILSCFNVLYKRISSMKSHWGERYKSHILHRC